MASLSDFMMTVARAVGKCQNQVPYSFAKGMYQMHGTYESSLWCRANDPAGPKRKEATSSAGSAQSNAPPPRTWHAAPDSSSTAGLDSGAGSGAAALLAVKGEPHGNWSAWRDASRHTGPVRALQRERRGDGWPPDEPGP